MQIYLSQLRFDNNRINWKRTFNFILSSLHRDVVREKGLFVKGIILL